MNGTTAAPLEAAKASPVETKENKLNRVKYLRDELAWIKRAIKERELDIESLKLDIKKAELDIERETANKERYEASAEEIMNDIDSLLNEIDND